MYYNKEQGMEWAEQEVTQAWQERYFPRGRVNLMDLKRELVLSGKRYGRHQFVLPTVYRLLKQGVN